VSTFIIWFTARHYEALLSEENKVAMDPGYKLACEEYKKMGRKQFYDKNYPEIFIAQPYLNSK
jgi:hypothetical protein